MGKNLIEEFIDADNRERVKAVLEHTLKTGEGKYKYEFPLYTKDHRKLTIQLSASAQRDQHGNIIGVQGIGTDATDSKWREEEFYRFTEMANAPVVCVDKNLNIQIWNEFTAQITGFA